MKYDIYRGQKLVKTGEVSAPGNNLTDMLNEILLNPDLVEGDVIGTPPYSAYRVLVYRSTKSGELQRLRVRLPYDHPNHVWIKELRNAPTVLA